MVDSNGLTAWQRRVAFSERDGVAYHPTEVLVHQSGRDAARPVLGEDNEPLEGDEGSSFLRFRVTSDPLRVVHELRLHGVFAQPNHVLFSHSGCSCCDPHPSLLCANPFHANPFHANPFHANPFHANPFHANPFHANPFHTNPFHTNYAPNRLALAVSGAPEAQEFRTTGVRSSSAQPAPAPPNVPGQGVAAEQRTDPSIVIVDTGLATGTLQPQALAGVTTVAAGNDDVEVQDADPNDGKLDSDAGHGTFIAGVIEGIVPGCKLRVNGLLTGQGDANEADVANTLESLVNDAGKGPDLVNLSFGGYSVVGMERLAEAVRKLQDAGTVVVASAGNDATCAPTYPAALPDVVAVGALGPDGPAFFTNYGPWVRACAPGIDIVSTFFTQWTDDAGAQHGEWVRWSGTSFAAPIVVAVLAEQMKLGVSGAEAVRRTIDAPGLLRTPGLGAVVNRVPWY